MGFSRQEYWSGVSLPSPRYADDTNLMAESEEGKRTSWWGWRKWQPTPVFLPGESQGQGILVGCWLDGVAQSRTLLKWLSSSSSRWGWRRRGEKRLKTQYSKNEDHGVWSHHFMANGENIETVTHFIFLGSKITVDSDCSHEIRRCLLLGRKSDKRRQHIKNQRHHFANKGSWSKLWFFQ